MGYITINTEIDINYDEIDDDDLMDIIEYKLSNYKRQKEKKRYIEFKKSVLECLNYDTAGEPEDEEGSVQDWLKDKVINELKTKYTLEELEIFLNKC